MEQQIHSGGGAVFRGDVTAGRDINISRQPREPFDYPSLINPHLFQTISLP
jgi:hypothetical protein